MASRSPFGRGRARRLLGLDRTYAKPATTEPGAPLHPWTLPNFVGYVRLAAIPLFLVLAYRTEDGTSFLAAMVFWAIAFGDYVDGFLARVTGQYSRLGALLDPVIDRLTILAGAVVCWSYELLPRWLLVVLALRELAMLGLGQYGLRHGVDLKINWPGRISVFPIMGGIWLALFAPGWVATGLVAWGVLMALLATGLYAQEGMRAVRASKRPA
jgi:CDP-diacylglycerol--glycerol-3-phosphate 3-phosphatidyltransferase